MIQTIKHYPAKNSEHKTAFVLCGFGGSIWQTRRLLKTLHKAGYDVIALDFSKEVLSKGDPQLMINLMENVTTWAETEARKINHPILLVGISLGALVSLNIMRRSKLFNKGILITGGDIVKVAHNIYGRKIWPQRYNDLAKIWTTINMYSHPAQLADKKILFVLPSRDKLIDPCDVRREVKTQNNAGNTLILIERHSLGHIGTIIEETILFPKRILRYMQKIDQN
ncbi:MAG TPA: hypothetical protein VF733_02190 [Candidatus Saccharimonadales bacterium]